MSAISQLRAAIIEEANDVLEDSDCARFLRARPGSIEKATELVNSWYEWRHTLLDPLPPDGLRFSPNIIMANPHHLPAHPYIHLLPGKICIIELFVVDNFIHIICGCAFSVAHHGWDKDGRPLYWEKTGTIQNNFDEVFEHFSTDELVQYHIMSQECFNLRFKFASAREGKMIGDSVVVFDMTNVNMTLNMQSIAYIKRILAVDQMYYPETLHKLFIINCPWYFTALYGLFKPFIDQRTKDKVCLLRSDYLPYLLEQMDISQIPEDFGGESADVVWNLQNPESSGCSMRQIEEYLRNKYSEENMSSLLSVEECSALKDAILVSENIRLGRATMWNLPKEQNIGTASIREGSYDRYDNSVGLDFGTEYDDGNVRNTHRNSASIQSERALSSQALPHYQHHHAHIALKPMRARMIKAEDESKYHAYCLLVEYGEGLSWPIRRRYSDFYQYNQTLKMHSKDFPSIVWPKLPPKSYFFKKSKSVVAVRLVGLDFFLTAVLDRLIRIELDSAGHILGEAFDNTAPCAIALRQRLRIATLEFLEVMDHVHVTADVPVNRDIVIRQLRSIDNNGSDGAVPSAVQAGSTQVRNESTNVTEVVQPVTRPRSISQFEKFNTYTLYVLIVCIVFFSGILGYYLRLTFIAE